MDYNKPKLSDYGDLVDLTAGQQDGDFTDAPFPTLTPKSQLTFSNP